LNPFLGVLVVTKHPKNTFAALFEKIFVKEIKNAAKSQLSALVH